MRYDYRLALFVGALFCGELSAQNVTIVEASRLSPPRDAKLDKIFSRYESLQLNVQAIYQQVSSHTFTNQMIWQLGTEPIRIQLYTHDIRHPDYTLQVLTEDGVETIDPGPSYTFKGWNEEDPSQPVRLSITPDYIKGFITDKDGTEWYIQPASDFGAGPGTGALLYRASDVIDSENRTCAANHTHAVGSQSHDAANNSHSRSMVCKEAEVAIAADYSMYLDFGQNATSLAQHLLDVKNLMEPNYAQFDVEFKVVTTYIVTNPGGDPWTASVSSDDLLNSFSCWAGTGTDNYFLFCTGQNGFGVAHDMGELWTKRNLDNNGVIGLAWIGTVCTGLYKYSIDEHASFLSLQGLRVLIAHECGHNFGANHDGSNSGYIMAPSVDVSATQFSSGSVTAINGDLPGYGCLGSCTPECSDPAVDFEITSIQPGPCQANPGSAYDLSVTVTHGGGNGSGFNVTVAGVDYLQSFANSPQTVVIAGLAADGAANIPVSVASVSNGDLGCMASGSYDAPGPCGDEIVENFNSCTLPAGWSNSTTNPYIFNDGDPEVAYLWKFANANRPIVNFAEANNSGLTIDGSCMAYFDDDITDIPEYTGINTLTSAVYNLAFYENLVMQFDYNFHNMEDGKPANNSYFSVQVKNAQGNWVSVLYDDNDACPWTNVWQSSCTTQFSLNIDAYKHSDFQVRFIYSDGITGDWTGMIALDNFSIMGDLVGSGSCDPVVTVTPPDAEGFRQASAMITTTGSINLNAVSLYTAPNVVINAGFTVPSGTNFEVRTTGCSPSSANH
ncbi:MAG: hypothetical protein HKN76_21895 [Saprospiraceae bacterium]|nr:hypothetical protein [Saprospiraceae bacterium]